MRAAGHAIEARIYAEDPADGFLPQAGRATFVRWSPRARVDAALEAGQEVGTWYDPMLGKVIAHGATREAARRALVAALDDTAIFGITTNLGFVRDLVASDAFRDAAIDTGWLDRTPDAVEAPEPDARALRGRLGAAAAARGRPTTRSRSATAGAWAGRPRRSRSSSRAAAGGSCCASTARAGIVEDGERRFAVHPTAAPTPSAPPPRDRRRACTTFFVERAAARR